MYSFSLNSGPNLILSEIFIEIMIIIVLVVQAGNFQYQKRVKKCMSYCSSVILLCCSHSVCPWTFQKIFQQCYFDGGQSTIQAFSGIRSH